MENLEQLKREFYAMLGKELASLDGQKPDMSMERTFTSADFDTKDKNKLYGNEVTLIYNTLREVSKDSSTPMLGYLEGKGYAEITSTMFDMHSITLGESDRNLFKLGENDDVYEPSDTYDRRSNTVMVLGVGYSRKILAGILPKAPVPNGQAFDDYQIGRRLQQFAIAKEDFIFNGDRSNPNETDGILPILVRENAIGNASTSITYSNPTGTNLLVQDDLENLIFSSLDTNGGSPENMVIWACENAMRTIPTWFDNKTQFTNSQFFTFLGAQEQQPKYLSQSGVMIPMKRFNSAKISNVSDKLLLLDMPEISLVRIDGFARVVDMPKAKPQDEINKAILDSLGVNFLYTKTSGFIANIDARNI